MNRQEAAQEQKLRNYFPWFGGLCLLYGALFAFCMYRNLFGCTFFISGGFQKIRVKIPAVAGTERQGFTSDGTIYGAGSVRAYNHTKYLLRYRQLQADPPIHRTAGLQGKTADPQLRTGMSGEYSIRGAEEKIPVCGI